MLFHDNSSLHFLFQFPLLNNENRLLVVWRVISSHAVTERTRWLL